MSRDDKGWYMPDKEQTARLGLAKRELMIAQNYRFTNYILALDWFDTYADFLLKRAAPRREENAMSEVQRYKFPDRVIADYMEHRMRTEGEAEYVLASDFDALLSREAGLRAKVDEGCKFAFDIGVEMAALLEQRDHLHALLTRCLTELDGDEMDKVRGVLVGEIRTAGGEVPSATI